MDDHGLTEHTDSRTVTDSRTLTGGHGRLRAKSASGETRRAEAKLGVGGVVEELAASEDAVEGGVVHGCASHDGEWGFSGEIEELGCCVRFGIGAYRPLGCVFAKK